MHKIEFIQPGLFTSLQDQGRISGRHWGIPEGGVMDRISAQRANLKLNNSPDLPVLEITGLGPTLLCHAEGQFALAGAQIIVFKNKKKIEDPQFINFKAGDLLKFGHIKKGFRTYVSIKNGFQIKELFGSVSPIAGISSSMCFETGDFLYFNSTPPLPKTNARIKASLLFKENTIKTIPGPEYDLLSSVQQSILKNTKIIISPSATRMAYPLLPKIDLLKHSLSFLTSPVVPGVVQLTPAGQLIVLMRDAQTTGGYPRVLVLTEAGLNRLAQMGGGQEIIFD